MLKQRRKLIFIKNDQFISQFQLLSSDRFVLDTSKPLSSNQIKLFLTFPKDLFKIFNNKIKKLNITINEYFNARFTLTKAAKSEI